MEIHDYYTCDKQQAQMWKRNCTTTRRYAAYRHFRIRKVTNKSTSYIHTYT